MAAQQGESDGDSKFLSILKALCLCTFYIFVSGGLINFNKFLMAEDKFPHALLLTGIHMGMSMVLCTLFYLVKPSAFPGMERTKGKRLQVLAYIIPIGCLFAVMLYGSNKAYLYCSVAFLQFMKEANVVMIFTFSCMVGLQQMNRQRFVVIAWILFGSSMCVAGDLHFALMGFVLQASSQVAECMRAILAEIILNSPDTKLDPLSYTLFMAPVCFLVLAIANGMTWQPEYLPAIQQWWPYLLPNASLAFVLNVTIASVIQQCSAVGFILTGLCKDFVLVVVSSILFHDAITHQQWLSFAVTLSGVFFWSFMKVCPDHVIVQRFEGLLGVPSKSKDASLPTEAQPLLPSEKKV